jgi:NAD(P)H-hydrate epimerase
MKISTVSEMRVLDRRAIEEYGIVEELLMENAGHAAYFVLQKEFGIRDKSFLVFCGTGNNGGDGCMLARKIHSNGSVVKVFVLSDPDKFRGAAKLNYDIATRLPIEVQRLETIDVVRDEIEHCDLVVDAIFGTGLSRDVGGIYRDVIELMNESGKPILSIDIPSGVTFGLPKIGNMLYPGYELGGKLYVSHISFSPSLYSTDTLKVAINYPLKLLPRDKTGHKGDFGEVLFIAGASNYLGAPYFAALSFLKSGGGYSRLATPASIAPFIANKGSEIVMYPQKETDTGSISLENKRELLKLSEQVDMVVLGPGISLEPETQQLARELTLEINKPLLIDGDGITAICEDIQILRERKAETILTPHLGEMSRITGMSIGDIESHKVDILQRTARELNAIIVMKGAHSLIGYPDQRVFINLSGNSGMATAGSGDVLTGTIAAMFGLGLPLQDAVRQGGFVHGLAGDLAADDHGEDGITAQDILDYLPRAVRIVREGLDETLQARYAGAHII